MSSFFLYPLLFFPKEFLLCFFLFLPQCFFLLKFSLLIFFLFLFSLFFQLFLLLLLLQLFSLILSFIILFPYLVFHWNLVGIIDIDTKLYSLIILIKNCVEIADELVTKYDSLLIFDLFRILMDCKEAIVFKRVSESLFYVDQVCIWSEFKYGVVNG